MAVVVSTMTIVESAVALPEGNWAGDISSASDLDLEITARLTADGRDYVLVESDVEALNTLTAAARDHPDVSDVSEQILDDGTVFSLVSPVPATLESCERLGASVLYPVAIEDGVAELVFRAPRNRVETVIARLAETGAGASTEGVYEDVFDQNSLSRRQQAVIETAVEEGYYETPRGCTMTELAESLDIAKSTCSELLHRAEAAIVDRFVSRVLERQTADEVRQSSGTDPESTDARTGVGGGVTASSSSPECEPDSVIGVLSNDKFQELYRHLDRPKTAMELAEEYDIAESTVYRGIQELKSAELIRPVGGTESAGNEPTMYERTFDEFKIEFGDTMTVECLR